MFGDTDRPLVLVINHKHPTECKVFFQIDGYIIELFKLAGTTEWTDIHIDLMIYFGTDIVLIIEKVLADNTFEEGEEYEHIPSGVDSLVEGIKKIL